MTDKVTKNQKAKYIVGIAVCALLIILSFCGRYFSTPFKEVFGFFLGSFGMAFYGILIALIATFSLLLAGKKIAMPTKYVVNFILLFVAVVFFVHLLTSSFYVYPNGGDLRENVYDYSMYVSFLFDYYNYISFGGIVFGSIVYLLEAVLTFWGALIVCLAFLAWTLIVAGDFFYCYFTGKITLMQQSTQQVDSVAPIVTVPEEEVDEETLKRKRAMAILMGQNGSDYADEIVTPTVQVSTVEPLSFADQSTLEQPAQPTQQTAVETLFPVDDAPRGGSFFEQPQQTTQTAVVEDDSVVRGYYNPPQETPKADESVSDWKITTTPTVTVVETSSVETSPIAEEPVVDEPVVPTVESVVQSQPYQEETVTSNPVPQEEVDVVDVVVKDEDDDEELPFVQDEVVETVVAQPKVSKPKSDPGRIVAVPKTTPLDDGAEQVGYDFITEEELEKSQTTVHRYMEYNAPPCDLLNDATIVTDNGGEDRQLAAQRIVSKLAVFGIKVELDNVIVGPSVTQYRFKVLSEKTRMGDFNQYTDDLKACLEATEDILIHAPVQGTNLVGIEVANKVKTPVVLRTLLESDTFKNAKGKLVFAIGKDLIGNVITGDLAGMPHLLVAGTTGSGKSVALNCLIVSLMYKYGPEYVRFLMVDPKYVELSRYDGIPHMLTREAIVNIGDALAGMDYLIKEMEARYQLFKETGVDSIVTYNRQVNPTITQKMSYLIYIVDELADLMTVNKKGFEEKLARLTAKARASGIHIVLATQRPSVDVITGTIKNNLSCRMALKVPSPQDSKTIINGAGADKLLGNGDMLYMGPGASSLARIQGAYVSNDEIKGLVEYLRESNELYYDEKVSNEIFQSKRAPVEDVADDDEEDAVSEKKQKADHDLRVLGKKALKFWITEKGGKASISSLQRGMNIGFNKAGRVYDMLQSLHYIEKPQDSEITKAVRVLVTLEQLDELFPDVSDDE